MAARGVLVLVSIVCLGIKLNILCVLAADTGSTGEVITQGDVDVAQKTVQQSSKRWVKSDACKCLNFDCGCCAHLQEKIIHLNNTICANVTYLQKDYGFSLTMTFDKYTVFNETLSLRNPPPVCIGAPYLEEFADVCVRLYDVHASRVHLHACVEVEAEFKHIRVAKYELGCFNMGGEELKTAILQMQNEVF